MAIFIPTFLFYSQQREELNQQKAIYRFDIFTNLNIALQSFMSKRADSSRFEKAKQDLLYELIPKAKMVSNQTINKELDTIWNKVSFIYQYMFFDREEDNLTAYLNHVNMVDSTNQEYYSNINKYVLSKTSSLYTSLGKLLFSIDTLNNAEDSIFSKLLALGLALDKVNIAKDWYQDYGSDYNKNHYVVFIVRINHYSTVVDILFDKTSKYFNICSDQFRERVQRLDTLVIQSNKLFQY